MTYNFCTLFDKNYFSKGLTLYYSLLKHCDSFNLWILCMDSFTYDTLREMNLKHVELIELKDFEDPELLIAKKNRKIVEYYFTCTPSLPLYILKKNKDLEMIAYLDADLFFYSSPEPIYREFGNNSIMIIPHRFLPSKKYQEKINGIYNVGMLVFRNNSEGIKCLQWWRNQCNECCCLDTQAGKVGDQKYLDEFPKLFKNVHILKHKGAGLAQWNIRNYTIKKINDVIYIDNDPLIFYHFFNFKIYPYSRWLPPCPWNYYTEKTLAYNYIYKPYIKSMQKAQKLYPFPYGTVQRPPLAAQLIGVTIRELKNLIKKIPGANKALFYYHAFFPKLILLTRMGLRRIFFLKMTILSIRILKSKPSRFKKIFLLKEFLADLKKYKKINKNNIFVFSTGNLKPCIFDKTNDTQIDAVCFYQDTWCAKKIFEQKPSHHYDIGSNVEMVGIISQFVPTTMIDIRPINLKLDRFLFIKGNILSLPFENNSLKSISSICVIEHIGLGRYGDKLDPWGSEKAINELKRVLAIDGSLYISLPVNTENIIYFNSHRSFTRDCILSLFQSLKLMEEKYIYKTKMYNNYDPAKGFGTGLFHFKKI